MKKAVEQSVKALCYMGLFLGMQSVVASILSFVYGMQIGYENAATGVMPGAEELNQMVMDKIMAQSTWIVLISGVLSILALWIFCKIRKKNMIKETQFVKFAPKYIPCVAIIGIAYCIGLNFTMSCLPGGILDAYMEKASNITDSSIIVTIISTMIVAPVVEELIFRGMIFSRLKKGMPLAWAVILTSIMFGLCHGQIVWTIYTFVLSVLLCIAVQKTGSSVSALLMHVLFNVFGVFVPMLLPEDYPIAVNLVIAVIAFVVMAISLVWLLKMPTAVCEEDSEAGTEENMKENEMQEES